VVLVVSIDLRGYIVKDCPFMLQVYNFLYDYETGISVNGAMSLFTFPDNHTGIYTSELSIIVPHIRLSLIISCDHFAIDDGMNKFDIPFTDNFTFVREDVHLHFSKPRPAETILQFVYGEINYEITAYAHTVPELPNYLNFAMIKQPKKHALDGVIGQFFKSEVKISGGDNSTLIQLNHHSGIVNLRRKAVPMVRTGAEIECWEAQTNAPNLVHDQHSTYLVPDMLHTPHFTTQPIGIK